MDALVGTRRMPVELGCCAGLSLLPLHSAVAAARLTSRLSTASSCRALSQRKIMLFSVFVFENRVRIFFFLSARFIVYYVLV